MPRKNIIDQEEYLMLIDLVGNGYERPSEIIKLVRAIKIENAIASEISEENLIMKLTTLVKAGYLDRSKKRTYGHSRGSRTKYWINYKGILINMMNEKSSSIRMDYIKNINFELLISTFKSFMEIYVSKSKDKTIRGLIYTFKKEMALKKNIPQDEAHILFKRLSEFWLKYELGINVFYLDEILKPDLSINSIFS